MEIERKFLVASDGWKRHADGSSTHIVQHYFDHNAVTIRHMQQASGMHTLHLRRTRDSDELSITIPAATWDKLGLNGQAALFDEDGFLRQSPEVAGRIRRAGDECFITLKAESGTIGARHELEFPIWNDQASTIEQRYGKGRIEKDRYHVPAGNGLTWEVDVYHADNAPLVTAEIELPHATAHFISPAWLGAEVTHLASYTNAALATHPYGRWSDAERAAPAATAHRA